MCVIDSSYSTLSQVVYTYLSRQDCICMYIHLAHSHCIIQPHTHTHTCTHARTHARTHTHTHTHTHTQGTRLSIPLNSSIMASLLYDPHDNMEEALAGFKFDTVGEICAMKTLPKVHTLHACLTTYPILYACLHYVSGVSIVHQTGLKIRYITERSERVPFLCKQKEYCQKDSGLGPQDQCRVIQITGEHYLPSYP